MKNKKRHSAVLGIGLGRFNLFLYAREFVRFHIWEFGISFDAVKGIDRYLDIEARMFCFGIGVRFVWLNKIH